MSFLTSRRFVSKLSGEPVVGPDTLHLPAKFALVSETSIGASWAHDANVPVVRASHFLKKLSADGLGATGEWLMARQYLPREGEHYEAVPVILEVSGYSLEWYGIGPLVEEMS